MAPAGKRACTGCSRRKLKCEDIPGQEACKECTAKERPCERPPPDRKRRGKACKLCKKDKTRCDDSDGHGRACARCVDIDVLCSFVVGIDEGGQQIRLDGVEHDIQAAAGSTTTALASEGGQEYAAGPSSILSPRLNTTDNEANSALAQAVTLSVDLGQAAVDDDMTGSPSASTPNSPNNNWWVVCLAPSPDA